MGMIYLSSDKYGLAAIHFVVDYLKEKNLDYEYLGVKSEEENKKLEELIPPFVTKIREDQNNRGIISCGTGIGVEVGVNKFTGIRACLATSPKLAQWAAVYDKCNVLCLPGWESKRENIFSILEAWFTSSYDGDTGRLKSFEVFDTWH